MGYARLLRTKYVTSPNTSHARLLRDKRPNNLRITRGFCDSSDLFIYELREAFAQIVSSLNTSYARLPIYLRNSLIIKIKLQSIKPSLVIVNSKSESDSNWSALVNKHNILQAPICKTSINAPKWTTPATEAFYCAQVDNFRNWGVQNALMWTTFPTEAFKFSSKRTSYL